MLIDKLRRYTETAATGDGYLLSENTVFRNRLDQLEIELMHWTGINRLFSPMESGGSAGDAASMLKVVGSESTKVGGTAGGGGGLLRLPFDIGNFDLRLMKQHTDLTFRCALVIIISAELHQFTAD